MTIKTTLRNSLCLVLVLLQVAAFPSFAIAEAGPEDTSGSTPAAAQTTETKPEDERGATEAETGPQSPTGAESKTYTKNEDGTWSNGKYTWDPNTKQTKPNTPQDYSYNPATGRWDTTEWVYHPETGKYEPNVRSAATNPNAPAGSGQANRLAAANGIEGTGPDSNNSINNSSTNNGSFDLFFNGSISGTINSNATSGNALVQGNTAAGSALTGDATAIANVLNMLQSSWLGQSGDLATFISNLDGDLYGDITIDPNQLPYTLSTQNNNVDVNISTNAAIDNDINLVAQSGDATVNSNTKAGDATTGNARAMANVINMINSSIAAGKSFLGMININGNLDGDILLPPGILEALLASTGPDSNNSVSNNNSNNLTVENTATQTINNNVDADATTGNANVSSNTSAGSANTGQATTSTNTMNVVGQNVTGKNGLLVFVNVLGKWVGMVVSPSGAYLANTGPGSNNSINGGTNNNVSVNSQENSLINNDINVAAHSGDANVTNNTEAGNATTGNAAASVNLLNMIGSNINVEDWFGILFINVFGEWFGSFGADTANGGCSTCAPQTGTNTTSTSTPAATASGNATNTANQVFGFIARGAGGDTQPPATDDTENQNAAVFGASTPAPSDGSGNGANISTQATQVNWWIIAGIIGMIATVIVLVREYLVALREERLA